MASELKVDKITGVTTAGSIDVTGEGNTITTNLQQGLVKAWAEFTGTGTAAFDDSFNMSSFSDNGTGNYDANFTNPFAGTPFSIQAQAIVGTSGYIGNCWISSDTRSTSNTGNWSMGYRQSSSGAGASVDAPHGWWTVNGDLA